MSSTKTIVRLEDSFKVIALLDADVGINVMTWKVMEDVDLAMQQSRKLELVSHTSHNYLFLGLCEDVEATIGGLKTRHPIFIVGYRDYNLVLDQSFLNVIKFSQEYKSDRIFGTIMHLQI